MHNLISILPQHRRFLMKPLRLSGIGSFKKNSRNFKKRCTATTDLPAIAKELADVLYVVYGTAVSLGIDMEPVFKEVHRSNMSKVGGYKREDGKWVKPSTYSPASLDKILEAQSVSP